MNSPRDPDQKVLSQSELARHLGLSDWTVSRAINGHPAVRESTRQRVLEAMRQVGFQPDPIARGLRGKKTGLIGVSFNELRNSILLEKLDSFERFLHENGLRSLLSFNERNEAAELRAIADFKRLRVDAVVLVQSSLLPAKSAKALAGLVGVHVDPLVSQSSSVAFVDRNRGMELLIDHLVALGHRNFGTLGILEINSWRWPGLVRALIRHGLDPKRHLKQYPLETEPYSFAMGICGAEQVLADPGAPSALIAINDHVALAAAQHLIRHGASVPGRFSVTGFDHLDFSEQLHPTLTTIDHRSHNLMEAAGNLLLDRLKADGTPPQFQSLVIEPQLILGESTGQAMGR